VLSDRFVDSGRHEDPAIPEEGFLGRRDRVNADGSNVGACMSKRGRCLIGAGLLALPVALHAASVTVSVSATIVPVHCSAEQRAHIRACATAEEQISLAPYKTMVTTGSTASQGSAPYEEIRVDQSRQVRIRTLLY
jgi:hypothetical protein